MTSLPEGFVPVTRRQGPFNVLVGPLFERRDGERIALGLRVEDKHTNSRGICHGGVLATLADLALGYAMIYRADARSGFVTVHLSLDYAGSARLGDWIESDVDVQKMGAQIAFCSGFLLVGKRRVVRASGVFALSGRKA